MCEKIILPSSGSVSLWGLSIIQFSVTLIARRNFCHPTLTWTTGSLTRICDLFYLHVYRHGGPQFTVFIQRTLVESVQNFTPEKSQGGNKAQHVRVSHPCGDHAWHSLVWLLRVNVLTLHYHIPWFFHVYKPLIKDPPYSPPSLLRPLLLHFQGGHERGVLLCIGLTQVSLVVEVWPWHLQGMTTKCTSAVLPTCLTVSCLGPLSCRMVLAVTKKTGSSL